MSSSYIESSSSSSDVSSSSLEISSSSYSSSGGGCSQYPLSFTPSDPLNACFATNGKCYKCNPDRGSECGYSWLWNSGFSEGNVGWWYKEVACDGSSVSSSSSGSGGCAPYPLLSTPSDPLNACFVTNGKCYKCNPDRGSECGYSWLWNSGFNEGNVGWWYKEVACGGESEDSDECPDISFSQKKSVLEKDLESSSEDISYEVWKNKTQIFYDALGRRTKADPKVRRYLFAPKGTYDKERNLRFSGSMSFLSKEYIEGYVSVRHKYNMHWDRQPCKCFPSTPLMRNLPISLSFRTIIDTIDYQNDPLLKIHEDKHIAIYNSLGNKNWMESIGIDLCEYKTIEELVAKHCPEMRSIAKSKFEEQLTILINAQNKWDDDDKNNTSHARIDLQERINEMRQDVDNFNCLE